MSRNTADFGNSTNETYEDRLNAKASQYNTPEFLEHANDPTKGNEIIMAAFQQGNSPSEEQMSDIRQVRKPDMNDDQWANYNVTTHDLQRATNFADVEAHTFRESVKDLTQDTTAYAERHPADWTERTQNLETVLHENIDYAVNMATKAILSGNHSSLETARSYMKGSAEAFRDWIADDTIADLVLEVFHEHQNQSYHDQTA